MKIAIVNSDQRMQQVYFNLSKDHEIVLINEFTNFSRFKSADALVLPIKGIDTTGSLTNGRKKLVLPESFWKCFADKPVFVGIPQPFLTHQCKQVYHYMLDAELKKRNAQYTAEGVLFLLIDNTSKCIQDLHVDIIGYGDCGKAIEAWLQGLQVTCRIIRRTCEEDEHFLTVEHYRAMRCGDVIINTSISSVIDYDLITSWENKPLIIDIATPDVIDYDTALKQGIRVIKAGNLPNMVAYESSGDAISEYVRGILHG